MKGVYIKCFFPRALKGYYLFIYNYIFKNPPSFKLGYIVSLLIFDLDGQINRFCIFTRSAIISAGTLTIIGRKTVFEIARILKTIILLQV